MLRLWLIVERRRQSEGASSALGCWMVNVSACVYGGVESGRKSDENCEGIGGKFSEGLAVACFCLCGPTWNSPNHGAMVIPIPRRWEHQGSLLGPLSLAECSLGLVAPRFCIPGAMKN